MTLRKFIIERDIPKVGTFERDQLRGAASKSNDVLRQLGPDIQWLESYVAEDKTFAFISPRTRASSASMQRSADFRQPRLPRSAR